MIPTERRGMGKPGQPVRVFFLFTWILISVASFAVTTKPAASAVVLGGCQNFYATYSGLTINSCTGDVCFDAHMKGGDMHGTQNWHINFGDGGQVDSTTSFQGNGGLGTWGGSTAIWDTITLHVCHKYSSGGTYNLTLSVTPAHTTCLTQFSISIPSPSPLTVNSPKICLGATATLTASGGTSYSWSTGATTTSIVVSPTATTSYSVWPASGGSCSSGAVSTVVVSSVTPNFSSTVNCKGVASFTDGSTANGSTVSVWSWSFPGGSPATSGSQNPSGISYAAPGTYTVTLTVTTASGCKAVITNTITVAPTLNPSVTSATICVGDTAVITASGGGTYSWSNGSNSSSISVNPAVTTSYSVMVTDASGCSGTAVTSVKVNPLPVPAFTAGPVCVGASTQFTDGSSSSSGDPIKSWSWSFPGGSPGSSTSQNPAVTYPAGTYTASLTVTTQGGCTSSITHTVTVSPLPVANMSGTNVCFNNANGFTDLSAGNTTIANWSWNFGDGKTSSSQNPSHTYANPGTYPVTLTVTNTYGCVSSKTITVVVNPLPAASFSSTPVCIHDSTCFTNLSTISSGNITGWSWNFGDPSSGANNISNLQNPCHAFMGANTSSFTVILTVTSDSGCQSTRMLPAVINPPPVANFAGTSVCLGFPTSFKDQSTAVSPATVSTWSWDFGDGKTSTGQNPAHTYSAPGNYTVTLIITSSQGCKDTIQHPVTVHALPVAAFTHPDSGCAPVCKSFQDLSQAGSGSVVSWQWSFPGGNPSGSAAQNGGSCWNQPGSYGVGLVVTNTYGCKDTIFVPNYINAFGKPKADFCVSPSQAPATDPVFSFCPLWSPNPGVTSWTWHFGDGSSDSAQTNPVHSYSASATGNDFYDFNVCLDIRNEHGCPDEICKPVELIPEFTFYIPNCVTPNGDGVNDFFFGKSRGVKKYTMWVFDRWGNLLWDCYHDGKNVDWDRPGQDGMSSACQWDAKVHGGHYILKEDGSGLVQEDVYVWKVQLTDIFNKVHNYIGHVSVVR